MIDNEGNLTYTPATDAFGTSTFDVTVQDDGGVDNGGVDFSKDTIAYCRIGERSSHSWFVLRYLLGIQNVSNYDGSWTEWGNLVGAPIEKP